MGKLWGVQVEPFQDSASGKYPSSPQSLPTAVQALAEVQETLARPASSVGPIGRGTLWGVQVEPFQDSASSISPGEVVMKWPTATQALAEVQETPSRYSGSPPHMPPGVGTVWGVQVEPFQDSANGPDSLPGPISYQPTAVHVLAEVQETPLSPLDFPALAAGTLWSVQLEPFQDSASGSSSLELISYLPTATQALAETQETPSR
ncbi:MAG TPA: hypothetical protein VNU24_04995 [Solirubrobacteraceae bacterium]|nr:hypothetical protein [Solirubrobacteraceae bacterium]